MPEASLKSAATNCEPHCNNNVQNKFSNDENNFIKNKKTNIKSSVTPKSKSTNSSRSNPQGVTGGATNNFELEVDNDNWPDVDVGNLIIDLDADIDKTMATNTSATTSGSVPAGASLSIPAGGGSATATLTEPNSAGASATDKSLKMKIKRTKTGSRGNTEGKLEIVPQSDSAAAAASSPASRSDTGAGSADPVANGTPDPIGLSAAEIVAAVKQNVKSSSVPLGAGKVRLTSSSSSSSSPLPTSSASATSSSTGGSTSCTPPLSTPHGPMAPAPTNSNGSKKISMTPGVGSIVGASSKPVDNKSNGGLSSATNNTMSASVKPLPANVYGASGSGPSLVAAGGSVAMPGNGPIDKAHVNSATGSSASSGRLHLHGNKPPIYSPQASASASNSKATTNSNSNNEPPVKKQKVDASVGTEMGTMTEPDCLGPLEPGTSVTLEGIVWHETDGGVLVINVTWRGKTYVGTLLDSTRHVNQWAPPRYSDSPTSELDGRTPKGRGKRSRGAGTPVETETRKNLRSSKVNNKGRSATGNSSSLSQANSPAKRKGRNGDGSDEKRQRTDSSRNSPEDDDDSEREQTNNGKDKEKENGESDHESTSSSKAKDEKEDDFTPKDKEEEKYVPPPPLPFNLKCPKPDCNKMYRHQNGLRYHVSHSHPELLDFHGEIKDPKEIEKMEAEASKPFDGSVKSEPSGQVEGGDQAANQQQQQPMDLLPDPSGRLQTGNPSHHGTFVGINSSRLPPPILSSPSSGLPPNYKSLTTSNKVPPIRPPSNARPIVPATGPQVMAGGMPLGSSSIGLKPIQPRPTIMPEPTPNLSLEELRKSKKDMKRKKDSSPGNSPPRNNNNSGTAINGGSPKSSGISGNGDKTESKSPAYSDISDDNDNDGDRRSSKQDNTGSEGLKLPAVQQPQQSPSLAVGNLIGAPGLLPPGSQPIGVPPAAHFPFSPYALPPGVPPQLPAAPNVPVKTDPGSPKLPKKEPSSGPIPGGPQPGTVEYEKMLQAYGFPPFPYPIPQGMDPNFHVQLLTSDPMYRAKYERDRSEKERQFKEQIDRDNREKDRRSGVVEDLRKQSGGTRTPTASPRSSSVGSGGTISVKPEFRVDPKAEPKEQKPAATPTTTADEGVKPTMETRGPPPSTPAFNYLHSAMFRPPPGIPYEHLLSPALMYGANPYLAQHLAAAAGFRAPFPMPGLPEDLSRSAAGAASATKALDLLHQHATQYYAAAAAASNASSNSVAASLGSPHSAHKIHELQDRALKSPSSGKSSPAPPPPASLSTGTTVTSATTTKSSTDSSGNTFKDSSSPASSRLTPTSSSSSSRGRSPPPLRHVHTHTHTHYGLGYPLLPPPPGAVPGVPPVPGVGAPPAHAGFPSTGFPSGLLPGKPTLPGTLPTFPPTK